MLRFLNVSRAWFRTTVKCMFKLVDFTLGTHSELFQGDLVFEDLFLGFYLFRDNFSNLK